MAKRMTLSLRMLISILLLTGCSDFDREEPGMNSGSNELELTWALSGTEEVQTYSLAALPQECEIKDLYILFFRAATHATAPNQYAGHTAQMINSSGAATGTARIPMPPGVDMDVTNGWQIVFLANAEGYADLQGAADVSSWLDSKLSGLTLALARPRLTAFTDDAAGIQDRLLITGEYVKGSGTNVASVTLTRRVARVDVVNSDPNFVLESVQVWNARTYAYLMDDGSTMTGTAAYDFVNYTGQTVSVNRKQVEGQLYAFPSISGTPQQGDTRTTCLIIGGKYNGNATSYYRVNVCAAGESQHLKGNSVYTVDIRTIPAQGETTPPLAHSQDNIPVDYTVNEWENSFKSMYAFDKDGNGLAISHPYVSFSESAGQYIDLEVFRILSGTNPIATDWTVDPVSGTNATEFTVAKTPGDTENRYVRITTNTENSSVNDREAWVDIVWGNLSVRVMINQLSASSRMDGVQAIPYDIWFRPEGDTKEISLKVLGDPSGVTITNTILYEGTQTGWLQVLAGTTPNDVTNGIYYYNIRAALLPGDERQASIKFVVNQGARISTATVIVRQSVVDLNAGSSKKLSVNVLERISGTNYTDLGGLTDWMTRLQGVPDNMKGEKHLHFAIVEYEQIKYKFTLTSPVGWRIVLPEPAASGLIFDMYSHPGDAATPQVFELKAAGDVGDQGLNWSGSFTIQYDDGEQTEFIVHQQGVLKTLEQYSSGSQNLNDGKMYYYGVFMMNGKWWLDRNIGATVGWDPDDPTIGYNGVMYSVVEDVNAAGVVLNTRAMVNAACPAGFRLPKRTTGSGEMDWLAGNLNYSGLAGDASVPYPKVYYVTVSDDPLRRLFLSYQQYSNIGEAYYRTNEAGYLGIRANNNNSNITLGTTEPTSINTLVRCIRNN